MTFTEVKEIPKRTKTKPKDSMAMLNQFMKMRIKTARVSFTEDEYKNTYSCCMALRGGISRYKYPVVIEVVNGDVYLTRTDM